MAYLALLAMNRHSPRSSGGWQMARRGMDGCPTRGNQPFEEVPGCVGVPGRGVGARHEPRHREVVLRKSQGDVAELVQRAWGRPHDAPAGRRARGCSISLGRWVITDASSSGRGRTRRGSPCRNMGGPRYGSCQEVLRPSTRTPGRSARAQPMSTGVFSTRSWPASRTGPVRWRVPVRRMSVLEAPIMTVISPGSTMRLRSGPV